MGQFIIFNKALQMSMSGKRKKKEGKENTTNYNQ
jgi:hypothetical protein